MHRVASVSLRCKTCRLFEKEDVFKNNNIPTQCLPERGHDSTLPLMRMRPCAARVEEFLADHRSVFSRVPEGDGSSGGQEGKEGINENINVKIF